MSTVVHIDCSFLAYQALHTMGDLSNGEIGTGVLFGFLSRVLTLGHLYATNQFCFAFDAPAPTGVRRRLFPGYKASRDKTMADDPEAAARRREMYRQLTELRVVLPSLGFNAVNYVVGFEADDLIAIGVRVGRASKCVLVTADEDMRQCLESDRVVMYNPTTRVEYSAATLYREFGLRDPSHWAMVKALAGCTSDDIPGIRGVGEPTASRFVVDPDSVTPRVAALVNAFVESGDYERNLKLVMLPHADLCAAWLAADTSPVRFDPNDFRGKASAFRTMCDKYGFASFLREPLFSSWRSFFKGEFRPRADPGNNVAHGRVQLRKPTVSPVKAAPKPRLRERAPLGGGFGF